MYETENVKHVQKRSGAVGNVFLCVQKCTRTDGAPWSEPQIFHTQKKKIGRARGVSPLSLSDSETDGTRVGLAFFSLPFSNVSPRFYHTLLRLGPSSAPGVR